MTWEQIDDNHERAAIHGGWLVKCVEDVSHLPHPSSGREFIVSGYDWRSSMCFVPDPHHEWDLAKDYREVTK